MVAHMGEGGGGSGARVGARSSTPGKNLISLFGGLFATGSPCWVL